MNAIKQLAIPNVFGLLSVFGPELFLATGLFGIALSSLGLIATLHAAWI